MQGYFYQVKDGKLVNLIEKVESQVIVKVINGVFVSEMVVYLVKGQVKVYIMVFIDIICLYCQKLYVEVLDLIEQGIEVCYMVFLCQGLQLVGDK